MFENPNTKKDEKVDDIFADTDTAPEKDELTEVVSVKEKKSPEPKEKQTNKNNEPKIEKFDESKIKKANDKSWLKPVIIGVLIIVFALVVFFVYGMFSGDEEDVSLLPPTGQEDEDFVPTPPEFVDPSLIIPEPEFIVEEPEIEEEVVEGEVVEESEIEEEIIEEEEGELVETHEINLLNYSFVDSDSDGLSDLAEELIGTDPNNPDTDGDSFTDYEELINGYNPLGDGLLPDNFPVLIYEDNNLSFYYPRNFLVQKIDNDSWALIAPDGARINLQREFTQETNIFNWYQDEFDDFRWIGEDRQIVNKNMERAIISSDGSMVFLLSNETNNLFRIDFEVSNNNDFNHYKELALLVNTLIQK